MDDGEIESRRGVDTALSLPSRCWLTAKGTCCVCVCRGGGVGGMIYGKMGGINYAFLGMSRYWRQHCGNPFPGVLLEWSCQSSSLTMNCALETN